MKKEVLKNKLKMKLKKIKILMILISLGCSTGCGTVLIKKERKPDIEWVFSHEYDACMSLEHYKNLLFWFKRNSLR